MTEKVLFLPRVTDFLHPGTIEPSKLTVSEQDETDEDPESLVGYGQPPIVPEEDEEKLGPDEPPFEMSQ